MKPLRYACSRHFCSPPRRRAGGRIEGAERRLCGNRDQNAHPEFNKDGTRPVKFEWGPPNKVWTGSTPARRSTFTFCPSRRWKSCKNYPAFKRKAALDSRGRTRVVVPSSIASPDLSTIENFKKSVLSAKAILYRDPSLPNMSGEMVERVLKKIDVLDQVKPRMTVSPRPEPKRSSPRESPTSVL